MTPRASVSRTPRSTAGTNSGGTTPPTVASSKMIPLPSAGLDVQLNVAVLATAAGLADVLPLGVGRAGDRLAVRDLGPPTYASTLNSRTSRSTMISRWSSPIPEMMVWPVS